MRLIDKDALVKQFDGNIEYFTTNETIEMIENVPVIDAMPVVHGEWILIGTNENHYETSVEEKCSLCGRYVYRYDTQPQDNYCPNCGADMRGSEVEE